MMQVSNENVMISITLMAGDLTLARSLSVPARDLTINGDTTAGMHVGNKPAAGNNNKADPHLSTKLRSQY